MFLVGILVVVDVSFFVVLVSVGPIMARGVMVTFVSMSGVLGLPVSSAGAVVMSIMAPTVFSTRSAMMIVHRIVAVDNAGIMRVMVGVGRVLRVRPRHHVMMTVVPSRPLTSRKYTEDRSKD